MFMACVFLTATDRHSKLHFFLTEEEDSSCTLSTERRPVSKSYATGRIENNFLPSQPLAQLDSMSLCELKMQSA